MLTKSFGLCVGENYEFNFTHYSVQWTNGTQVHSLSTESPERINTFLLFLSDVMYLIQAYYCIACAAYQVYYCNACVATYHLRLCLSNILCIWKLTHIMKIINQMPYSTEEELRKMQLTTPRLPTKHNLFLFVNTMGITSFFTPCKILKEKGKKKTMIEW